MAMQRTFSAMPAFVAVSAVFQFSAPANAFDISDVGPIAGSIWQTVEALIGDGYHAAPALMLGLALLAIMPFLAVIAPVVERVRRPVDATRRYNAGTGDDISSAITGEAAGQPAHAFVEVVGSSGTRFAILHDMLRIGREDDNDIRIPSTAVHRYHAAIYREHRDDWHIADLSGSEGNGIRVNGQRCSDARLHDGDVIDLGPGRLRFRAGLL